MLVIIDTLLCSWNLLIDICNTSVPLLSESVKENNLDLFRADFFLNDSESVSDVGGVGGSEAGLRRGSRGG